MEPHKRKNEIANQKFRIKCTNKRVQLTRALCKKHMKKIFLATSFITLISCADDGYLRGAVEASVDGETYFGIIDDNGGHCGPILLDGERWNYPIGEVVLIAPGEHTIHCGGTISFNIPEGVVFKFDYWGP